MTVGQIIRWVVGMDDMPPMEEADRAFRKSEKPWMSRRARAAFAQHQEIQGVEIRETQDA